MSQWDDKSGNANHLTANGSGIFTDSRTRNSSNVLDIEQGSYFTRASYQLPADCSIFMMAGIDSINVNTDALLAIRGGAGYNFQFDSGDVVGDQDQFFARFNAAGNSQQNASIGTTNIFSPTTDQKGPSIYELIFDLDGDGDLEVFIDGNSLGTTTYTSQCGANSELLLFANRSVNQFPDGFAGEFIVVPSVLSATDRQKMEGYLAHKWGLTAQLDASHPYKTSRPLASDTSSPSSSSVSSSSASASISSTSSPSFVSSASASSDVSSPSSSSVSSSSVSSSSVSSSSVSSSSVSSTSASSSSVDHAQAALDAYNQTSTPYYAVVSDSYTNFGLVFGLTNLIGAGTGNFKVIVDNDSAAPATAPVFVKDTNNSEYRLYVNSSDQIVNTLVSRVTTYEWDDDAGEFVTYGTTTLSYYYSGSTSTTWQASTVDVVANPNYTPV